MDIKALEHFVAACHHGNLTAAAAELGVTQPALSKSIKRLEASLGVRLVERGRFGVRATPMGDKLVVRARLIAAQLASVEQDVAALRGKHRTEVVLGCGPTEATRLLPRAAAELARVRPELKLVVLYGLNEALMPWVLQGEVEFALSSIPMTATDPELQHESLLAETAAVMARAGHPLAGRRTVKAADLAAYPWCLARRRELERRALDELFLANGLKPPEAQIETTSTVLMKSVVMTSDFLTFLPRELAYWEERAGHLVPLAVAGPVWSRNVGITWRRREALSSNAIAVIEALRAMAGEFRAPAAKARRRGT